MSTFVTFIIAIIAHVICAGLFIWLKMRANLSATTMHRGNVKIGKIDWKKNWMFVAHVVGWIGLAFYHAFALIRWAVGG